ncbi:CopG family transcriptional regulator [Halovenus sp. HT40]|uniref:CopG family transcriptional regulator n=1 Tax=Halovenus sp. HT40 TaxID=3126691 RepID=UPI00300F30B3
MGNKNKTISFRVSQEKFETLRGIAEERDISLSAVFRDYVDLLVAHDGQVEVVPEHEINESTAESSTAESFPPKVEVPKSFVREHERLELEAEHLREQLEEHKRYVTKLRQELDEYDQEDIVHLDELDGEGEEEESPYRIGSDFDDSQF